MSETSPLSTEGLPGEPSETELETLESPPDADEEWKPRAAGEIPQTLARLLGLPRAAVDENYLLLDRRVEGSLEIEEFSFDSEPGEEVTGILAKPDEVGRRFPAVLCLHGVNQGRKTVMGERYYYDTRLNWLRGWGRELARHSFLTAGITQRTFGKRPGELTEQGKLEQLYGRSLMGAFVGEALQALDLLARRDDVDKNRLGIMGYGLGGVVAFYTAVLDDRVKALVTASGGVGSLDLFARWADPNVHDVSYYIPGILDHFDHPELAASLAPRAYLLLARDGDTHMPLEGVRRVEWEGSSSYTELAIRDRLKVSIRPGEHDFTEEEVYEASDWLTQWLSDDAQRAFETPDPDAAVLED